MLKSLFFKFHFHFHIYIYIYIYIFYFSYSTTVQKETNRVSDVHPTN